MAKAQLPVLITPEGYAKLKSEIDYLWKQERPRVTAEVEAAAALGDRSENAEYIYGKKRLREIDRRLKFLSGRLEKVQVLHPPAQAAAGDAVGFGAWVTIEDEDGVRACYRLVGPDEPDPDNGLISVDSPMGRALLGKHVDDEVEVRRPRGDAWFTIVALRYGERPPSLD
ncbi:transcription elongation factor GreB [Paraliomyxa miuraensis]|uniref:transcription elongation factor GreB n=1 Tax=Paraliomyxa miuraensis TaxID=376150 RepID=UPI00225114A6|nr:transcription elongation factor GreB [Paraliomyxa miuraensis]MCX4244825.1 transcription elongation factor GreB [Paraliomyxa miuraensis]